MYPAAYCGFLAASLDSLALELKFLGVPGRNIMMAERRTSRRFDMRLPLVVRWPTAAQPASQTEAETIDVSSRGLYFTADDGFSPGSPIEVLLTLPHEITLAGPVRVRCQGRVVRVESAENSHRRIGIAAVIERYEFMRAEQSLR